jgi:hypothetical protein
MNHISALGLIFDIVGILGLFFTKIKSSWTIPTPQFDNSFLGFGVANNEQYAILKMQRDIVSLIDKVNIESKRMDRRSYIWLAMIILGFILQLSLILFCRPRAIISRGLIDNSAPLPANSTHLSMSP